MRMSTIATSGRSRATMRRRSSASAASPTTSTPASESSRASPTGQHDIVSDYDAHGITAVTVSSSGVLDSVKRPPRAPTRRNLAERRCSVVRLPACTSTRTVSVSRSWTAEIRACVAAEGWSDVWRAQRRRSVRGYRRIGADVTDLMSSVAGTSEAARSSSRAASSPSLASTLGRCRGRARAGGRARRGPAPQRSSMAAAVAGSTPRRATLKWNAR